MLILKRTVSEEAGGSKKNHREWEIEGESTGL